MSTLKTTNVSHGSNSGTANLVLADTGNVTVGADLIATKQNGCQRIILEEFGSPCDGSVIATSNGNVTYPNVPASELLLVVIQMLLPQFFLITLQQVQHKYIIRLIFLQPK